MGKSYQYIFWGIVFVFIDINMGPLDIMPDIIGYFLIINGLSKLYHLTENRGFFIAKSAGVILTVFSIFNLLVRFSGGLEHAPIVGMAVGVIVQMIQLVMVFYIYEGTITSLAHEDHHLTVRMKSGQKLFAYLYLITAFITPFMLNIEDTYAGGIMIMCMIANVCAVLSWAANMHRAHKFYQEKGV
ncbi:hypothetical protein HZI73_20810 [Vallitalea pronyensis]|uniref:Uncharacterized protein n=1 Tax=Vallitalea pronyensis TaxID=1348613 RepID=A0A8J8MN74_9FIRM|nr:hypothetical protein [Vallitalea pronyensis]QUI24594.1 hypothetical protein HZI73_20810 [Vallitalea pronyensis]